MSALNLAVFPLDGFPNSYSWVEQDIEIFCWFIDFFNFVCWINSVAQLIRPPGNWLSILILPISKIGSENYCIWETVWWSCLTFNFKVRSPQSQIIVDNKYWWRLGPREFCSWQKHSEGTTRVAISDFCQFWQFGN